MFLKPKLNFEIGFALDRGKKRNTKPNQDSLIVLTCRGRKKLPPILVLADGMGGYAGGAAASQAIIKAYNSLYRQAATLTDFSSFSNQAISLALEEMKKQAGKDPRFRSMGSTLVAVCLLQNRLSLVNVGDSRAYRFHKGDMQQINYDHSFIGEAVRAGLLQPQEAMNHPKKNQLTQSITPSRTEIKPYFVEVPFEMNDVVLLCSDGLWGVISEPIIQSVVLELPVQKAAEKLVKLANARGGPDNISVIVARHIGAVPVLPYSSRNETLPG